MSDALHPNMPSEEIQALHLEALKLHCNTRNLVQSGPRKVLAEGLYQWLEAQNETTIGTIECQDEGWTRRVKRHSGKSSTQSTCWWA